MDLLVLFTDCPILMKRKITLSQISVSRVVPELFGVKKIRIRKEENLNRSFVKILRQVETKNPFGSNSGFNFASNCETLLLILFSSKF